MYFNYINIEGCLEFITDQIKKGLLFYIVFIYMNNIVIRKIFYNFYEKYEILSLGESYNYMLIFIILICMVND